MYVTATNALASHVYHWPEGVLIASQKNIVPLTIACRNVSTHAINFVRLK